MTIRLELSLKGSVNVALEVSMPDPLSLRLAELPQLNKAALDELWKQFFDVAPSPKLRRDLMIPILAHRLQDQAFGSLKPVVRTRLRQLSRAFERDSDSEISARPQLRPVHLVNVETNGYEYQGAQYKSLSEIARLITGTRWSGPLFFGIKNEHGGSKSKEAR
jgi:hypothetical protein